MKLNEKEKDEGVEKVGFALKNIVKMLVLEIEI